MPPAIMLRVTVLQQVSVAVRVTPAVAVEASTVHQVMLPRGPR